MLSFLSLQVPRSSLETATFTTTRQWACRSPARPGSVAGLGRISTWRSGIASPESCSRIRRVKIRISASSESLLFPRINTSQFLIILGRQEPSFNKNRNAPFVWLVKLRLTTKHISQLTVGIYFQCNTHSNGIHNSANLGCHHSKISFFSRKLDPKEI